MYTLFVSSLVCTPTSAPLLPRLLAFVNSQGIIPGSSIGVSTGGPEEARTRIRRSSVLLRQSLPCHGTAHAARAGAPGIRQGAPWMCDESVLVTRIIRVLCGEPKRKRLFRHVFHRARDTSSVRNRRWGMT